MLRIFKRETPSEIVLRPEGMIVEETLDELERMCEELSLDGRAWRVDLGGVVFVDRAGVRSIRRLAAAGICLDGGSPFVAALLEEAPRDAEQDWTSGLRSA